MTLLFAQCLPRYVLSLLIHSLPVFLRVILAITNYSPYFFKLPHAHLMVPLAAAAAAMSLQLCPTLCDPIDGSPPGSPVPGILQARTLECVAISLSNA